MNTLPHPPTFEECRTITINATSRHWTNLLNSLYEAATTTHPDLTTLHHLLTTAHETALRNEVRQCSP